MPEVVYVIDENRKMKQNQTNNIGKLNVIVIEYKNTYNIQKTQCKNLTL